MNSTSVTRSPDRSLTCRRVRSLLFKGARFPHQRAARHLRFISRANSEGTRLGYRPRVRCVISLKATFALARNERRGGGGGGGEDLDPREKPGSRTSLVLAKEEASTSERERER